MSWAHEQDELGWEARRNVATTFRFWLKVAGQNVLAETSPAPTFTVHDPSGTQIQSGTATVSTSGTPPVSSVSVALSAIGTLGEEYSVRLTWRVDGESVDQLAVRTFDVVLHPFGGPSVSLNDFREERADADKTLERIGVRLGYAAGPEAQSNAASVFAMRARLELETMIRAAVTADGQTRPALMLSRERLNRIERYLALKALFVSEAKDPLEGDDSSSALYRHYAAQAEAAWKALGPLKYDRSEDLVPDSEVEDLGQYFVMRRVQ